MSYKVEIFSTQTFTDGKIFNQREEKWFDDEDENENRSNAFFFLKFFSPIPKTTFDIHLYFYDDDSTLEYELCIVEIKQLEDYSQVELKNNSLYFHFNIDNLHQEYLCFFDSDFSMPDYTIVLEGYKTTEFDLEQDKEIEVTPKILAENRPFINKNSNLILNNL